MSAIASATGWVERLALPDALTELGVFLLVARTRRSIEALPASCEAEFAGAMRSLPIALHTGAANRQHYELPPQFFELTLGPRRKYSCCFYPRGAETLAEAEIQALQATAEHAALADGQRILELGCGWGSLTLFMAERYPHAQITAVSNSAAQRRHIEAAAQARGIGNLNVITADMNEFEPAGTFERVVSVEMFEHISNWHALLQRIRRWLSAEGRVFIHVFSHRRQPYRFDHADQADWIARHFFTGGIMPSHGLMSCVAGCFNIERQWRWSGLHYRRTARHWLDNFDANEAQIRDILVDVYGTQAALWHRRWRLFYLATAGLFGHAGGGEWGVSHYRLRANDHPADQASARAAQ